MDPLQKYAEQIAAIHHELEIPADYALSRRLALQPEAIALVEIVGEPTDRQRHLAPPTARAWLALQAAAAAEGIELRLLSAFRSVAYQRGIVERKRARGLSWEEIFRLSAAPGYSEHHTGKAIDLGTPGSAPLEETFAESEAFRWLLRHAPDRGWRLSFPVDNSHGIAFEPWHWFFQG